MTHDSSIETDRQITILRSKLHLCKRFVGGKGEGYPNAKHFDVYTRELSGINSLLALITKLNDYPHAFVIRGEVIGNNRVGVVRRTLGESATFRDPANGRRWACIDIDSVRYWGLPQSQESVRRCVEDSLPRSFAEAACVYQWSASAGVDGWELFRLHLWFWLDRPVCRGALSDWLHTYPVDPSLFRTVQPHYTARPIFEGCEDPVTGERVGMLIGAEAVTVPWNVPAPALWREAERLREVEEANTRRKAREAYMRSGTARVKDRRTAVAQGILKRAGKAIIEAIQGGRHDAIYSESAGVGNFVGSGLIDRDVAIAALIEVSTAALPANRKLEAERTIRAAISDGEKTPRSIAGV